MRRKAAIATAPFVVFTDLDGTLLDGRTYHVGPARAALEQLAARGIPVVFCSSKTAAEQRPLRAELGLSDTPFIVENGSAVLVPESSGLPVGGWPGATGGERQRTLGRTAAQVRAGIARAAARTGVRVRGYADLSAREVAELTGLDEPAAARARQREYSETLIDQPPGELWPAFESALADERLGCQHGGRFCTVTGAEANKGWAVRVVNALLNQTRGRPIVAVGVGDSANDASMLAVVDRPYLLARDDGQWTPLSVPGLRRIARAGPEGWCDAILDLLTAS